MEDLPPVRRSGRAAALVCKEKLRQSAGSGRAQKAKTKEVVLGQQGFLFDLPQGVIEDILHRAGLHSRELCKAIELLYGPLHCLTPRGLRNTADLNAVLRNQSRHRHQLHTLDLKYASQLVTNHSLKILSKALPRLQELRLPFATNLTPAGLCNAQPLLSSLTALHLPSCTRLGPLALEPIAQLTNLKELTLPTTTAVSTAAAQQLAQLSACSLLSKLAFSELQDDWKDVEMGAVAGCAHLLPMLVSLKVEAHNLTIAQPDMAQLQRLTALTQLGLRVIEDTEDLDVASLLQAVGTMRHLRSLQLHLVHSGWTPAERGWLTGLSLLTSLDVRLCFVVRTLFGGIDDDDDAENGAFDEVATAVPHLPALRELRLSSDTEDPLRDLQEEVTDEAFARLASAGSCLQLLELQQLNLSDNWMDVIQQLTGLTSLRVRSCDGVDSFAGLTALTGLRELVFDLLDEAAPNVEHLQPLTGLQALALRGDFMQKTYLTRLCATLPQLRTLDISGNWEVGAGLNAIKRLTNLEVLDLTQTVEVGRLWPLKPPKSLWRCFLGHLTAAEEQRRAREAMGQGIEVVFSGWQHEWWVPLHLRGY